jgi:hypothetical protein
MSVCHVWKNKAKGTSGLIHAQCEEGEDHFSAKILYVRMCTQSLHGRNMIYERLAVVNDIKYAILAYLTVQGIFTLWFSISPTSFGT